MIPGIRLVMLGRQGSGKGTQCPRLARHYVVPHISTGDIFRAAVKSGSELGRELDEYMRQGRLVPDEMTISIVRERLNQDDTRKRGFILDGFPRTGQQAEALDKMLAAEGMPLDVALVLHISEEEAVDRLLGRRVCSSCGANYSVKAPPKYDWTCDVCGGEVVARPDDNEQAIVKRLAEFRANEPDITGWYEGQQILESVEGHGDPDQIMAELIKVIDRRRK